MGSGIAEVCARAGLAVTLVEANTPAAKRAEDRIAQSLERAVARGKLESGDAEEALSRLTYTDDLGALADRELVVEAVVEDKAAKLAVFASLDDSVVSNDAIFASNTSSIPEPRRKSTTTGPLTRNCSISGSSPIFSSRRPSARSWPWSTVTVPGWTRRPSGPPSSGGARPVRCGPAPASSHAEHLKTTTTPRARLPYRPGAVAVVGPGRACARPCQSAASGRLSLEGLPTVTGTGW